MMFRRHGPTLLLALSGLSLIGVGWVGISAPQDLMAPLGIPLAAPSAHSEIRAAYGGMHFAVGLLLLYAAARADRRRAGLRLTLCFMGGLTVGRLVSLAADGVPNAFVVRLLLAEALAAVLAGVLLRGGRAASTA